MSPHPRAIPGGEMSPFPGLRSDDLHGGEPMDDDALRALPRDAPNFHQRQASHLRALAARVTISSIKGQLLAKAEDHERLASAKPEHGN